MSQEVEVVSLDDAVKLIGCKKTCFYQNHKDNLQMAGKVGRNVYFDLEHLKMYIKKANKNKLSFKVVKID